LRLVERHFDLGRSRSEGPYLVPRVGARIAMPLRDQAALSSQIAAMCVTHLGTVVPASVIRDVLTPLAGRASAERRRDTPLRFGGNRWLWLDTGDAVGRAIRIKPDGWSVRRRSGIVFRRTPLTDELPRPSDAGDLTLLRDLLNVDDADWPLLVAYLSSLFDFRCARPILVLAGPVGSGKSCAMSLLKTVVDPATVREPFAVSRNISDRDWRTIASTAAVLPLDDADEFTRDQFKRFARAVTGAVDLRRALWTDHDAHAVQLKVAIMLTTIGLRWMPADFASRALRLDLVPFGRGSRLSERALWSTFRRQWPRILGGLLDHVVEASAVLPSESLDLRMADFARWVVDSDKVLAALLDMLQEREEWQGTSSELLRLLREDCESPVLRSPEKLSRHLSTHQEELERVGVIREEMQRGSRGERYWRYFLESA
jgi:hypothetical protein